MINDGGETMFSILMNGGQAIFLGRHDDEGRSSF
jgi:hypothetical protein